MIQSSIRMKWEDIWMIIDDLKWFQVKKNSKIFKAWNTKKNRLAALTQVSILAITWVSSIALRWFLKYCKDNSKGYNFCVLYKSQFGLHHRENRSWNKANFTELKTRVNKMWIEAAFCQVSFCSQNSVICSAISLMFILFFNYIW